MAFAFSGARPARELQMPPRPRRRRARTTTPSDVERFERNFWQVFDLEKFASDWQRSLSRKSS